MPILEIPTLLSDGQDLSQAAGDYYSDILPLASSAVRVSKDAPNGVGTDKAKGNPLLMWGRVDETFASGGAATLQVVLETATDEAFTSPVAVFTSKVFTLAELVAGAYVLPQHVPYGLLNFMRIKYTIASATTTAGTVTAGLTLGHQSND